MQDQGPWDGCPSGVVAEMAGQLRRRKRRAQLRPFVFIGVALLLSAIGYGLTSRDEPGTRDSLNCRETVPLLAKYRDQSLDAALANRVRDHLSHCPSCRKHYEERFPSEVRNRPPVESGLLAIAARFHD